MPKKTTPKPTKKKAAAPAKTPASTARSKATAGATKTSRTQRTNATQDQAHRRRSGGPDTAAPPAKDDADCAYYFIAYNLQKCDGTFPSSKAIAHAYPEKTRDEVIAGNMRFALQNSDSSLPLVAHVLVDDGLGALSLTAESYNTGPKPVIWLKLAQEVDVEDDEVWSDALSSDYELSIAGVNNEAPFYFQDQNSYSKVMSAEWVSDEVGDSLAEMVQEMEDGETTELTDGTTITREFHESNGKLQVKLVLRMATSSHSWTWLFKNRADVADFAFLDNTYTDTAGKERPEWNPELWRIYKTIVS